MNTVDCLKTDKTMPRKKYWRMSKARQTVEDTKTLSSEVGVLKLSDGGLSQPKTPSVSLEMGVMKISDGGNAQPKKPSVSVEMGVMKISDGGNAQPKKPSVSLEMGVMNLSDGGNAQPTKPSVSEIADIVIDTLPETLKIPDTLNEPLNVSLNEHMPHTLSELMPNAVSKTNTEIHLVPDTLINTMSETSVTHNDSYSFAHNDTHHCSHNDSHSIPHSAFHSTPLACDKSFAVQFMESSVNDCLKTQIDFDIAFAEAFPKIVVKRQTCNNEELTDNKEVCNNEKLTENKEVAYIELIESNETSFCDSHFEIIDTDDQVAKKPLFKSLIASDSSNSQTSFDVVFLDNFPEVAANYQSRDKELSERERMAFCPVNTSQQNEELKRNVTAQHQLSSDPLEVCSDNDVACYQAVRSSELLWNAIDLVFGSFHQSDGRFSEHSRGYQCTCNALCMLSYAHCGDVDNSMVLDKVLYEGDALYQAVIRKLKSDGKLSQHLLSLEEIPDDFEVEIGKFTIEKLHIESGPLIDTQDIGLPTLHEVLQSAFLSVSSGLLTVGAICSAVFKKKGAFAFFDSHCHGYNGLSATDGASSLITFSSLDDLVRYMYAFYDSMKLDTSMQYDFLPINVKKSENKQSYKDEMASHMEAYFNDQRLRQANKSQSEVRSISNDLSSIAIEKSEKALWAKRKEFKDRSEYFKNYKRKCRQNSAFKGKERDSKQSARQNPVFRAKESIYQKESKQAARQNPVIRAKENMYQKESKQTARKDPVFKTKERESKQSARQNPVFRAKESIYQKESKQAARQNPVIRAKENMYQKESKQTARKDPVFKTKERESKQSARQNPVFRAKESIYQKESKQAARQNPVIRAKENMYQKESKQSARKDSVFKAKERESKQSARQNPVFRAKESINQKESKQAARQNPVFKAKERESKQSARQNPVFRTKESMYQKESKQAARQNPVFKAKERESKQSARQNPVFRTKESMYQKESKQSARKVPVFKTKERESKQLARRNPGFRAKETVYQKESKRKARENPYFLECERIKKQQLRQEKRKFNDDSGIDVPRKRCKHDTDTLPKSHQKDLTIEESIKQFHSDIAIGPLYVCSCCHQTWFKKSVSMLKNTHISAESKRLHCTDFTSVGNEEWICHTCLSALRESKPPKLSVANGMKWPDKPPELNLHQLEERLIALRIPFMQIRELPRGGQYSLKGNVINVPVDIQPTINCLPRPMDENFTVAIQLKKKLSYKKVDFKENVRPLRVLTALHWLMNNSELYKKSGIIVDDKWFQEVTESAEDTVREFLEVSKEQCKDKDNAENEKQKQDKTNENDIEASNDYDSDHYSEVDANEQVGNIDTLVDDADIDNKYDKVFTFAPGEGQHPLSLYQDKDAEYLCFPTISCGQTPPSRDERLVPVHYSDIVKWELRSVDRRAAQSVPNIFFKHKKLQMKQISDKVNLAVRRCKNRGKKITAAEARDSNYLDKLVNLDEGYYIFRQLRNSPAYLETRKKYIFAMIRQLSLPTWFMSLSAADTRWTDLLKMLAKLNDGIEYSEKELEHLTWQEKTKLVQKDPVTCSRYFDHRVQEFLNTVLKSSCEPIGKLLDFFYRVEFQQRGSPHIHMLVWIENAPTLETHSEEEIVQFVDQYLTSNTDNEKTANLVGLQSHKHSKTCRKKGKPICRFGFPLPPLPRTMLLYPLEENVDKYKKKNTELLKVMNEYKDNVDMTFEEFLENIAKMDFEDYIKCIRSSLKAPKVFSKRKTKDMRINLFNEGILLAWKANLDIQIVLEPYGCASYIVGYISKSQRGMSAQLDAAAKEARKGNLDLKKQVRHIGNVFSNCVEVSAQEAVYLDLQIPLTKCTRDIVFINTSVPEERIFLLKPKAALDELPGESTDVESDNVIQRYSKRLRQLSKFCLADYVSKVDIIYPKGNKFTEKVNDKNDDDRCDSSSSNESEDSFDGDKSQCSDLLYKTKNGTKYKKRKVPRIIRYVKYNKKKDPENYFREQLMLFVPWRNEQKDLLGSFDTYEAHYNSVQTLLIPKRNEYEHHIEELELARQMMEDEQREYDQTAPNAEQENREAEEEGSKESEQFVYFNPSRVVEHRHYDIGIELQSTCSVPPVETTGILLPDDEYLTLLRSLNLRQREFFNHIVHWIKCKDEPVYAFLTGGAGVGKSVVIRALYQTLYRILNLKDGENPDDKRILLCAYMGFAAFNISGQTICSAFHKQMYKGTYNHLSADELNTFRIKYRHLKVVIIDEISMVGNMTLSFIDTRLQQLTGSKSAFGGLSVIAVGDLYQLKPVGDFLICLDLKVGASSLARNLWKELFTMYELVDIMRQKDDLAFAQLLNRLRLNEMTVEDKQMLQTRVFDRDTGDYPKDAVHLFARNFYVKKHNDNILSQLPGEKIVIPCHDNVVSANIPAKECQRLINSLPDDYSKTGQLMKSLTVVVGMIVVHTANVDVEDGLTNGATGVVKQIDFRMEGTNRPSIIWVLFDDPRVGRTTREKYRKLYNSSIHTDWTPVFDVQRTFILNYKTYQRIQFPLTPASGKSVWKAEGATVDRVVVDLSQEKGIVKIPHIHYVALSRVKRLTDLYILNMNEASMALDDDVNVEMHRLRTEAVLELCYVPLYKTDPGKVKIAFNNARSLHKHFRDVEFEPNVLAADAIGFAETRLCRRDENVHYALKRFRLIRLDDAEKESGNRPHHGLALYVKEYFQIQKVVKMQCKSFEFIFAAIYNIQRGYVQVVVLYKYPRSSQTDFRKDIHHHLRPVINLNVRLVILGDFNIQIDCVNTEFVKFMETSFRCRQQIKQSTTDSGSILDLIFSNCESFCDVVEAYWTDHKLVYCAIDQ